MKIAITAGFDKSLPALLMAERLRLDGHEISAVIVVSPYSLKRLRSLLLSRGLNGVKKALHKLVSGVESKGTQENPLQLMHAQLGLSTRSLKHWCKHKQVRYQLVNDINHPLSIETIKQSQTDVLVYGGGGILKDKILESVKGKVINPHAGPLPEIRGMNAIEWATLLQQRQTVTIHFIDKGIDTGRLISEYPVPVSANDTIESLRAKAVASGIEALTETLKSVAHVDELASKDNLGKLAGRQCYPLSKALTELLEDKLEQETKCNRTLSEQEKPASNCGPALGLIDAS